MAQQFTRRGALKNSGKVKTKSLPNRKIQLVFGSAILTLLVVGAISYRAMVVSNDSERWVQHTLEVLANLQDLLSDMESIESNSRGFALTGEEWRLVSYRANMKSLEQHEAAVHSLTVDNPAQQRQMPALNRLAAQEVQFSEMVIEIRRAKGFEAAAHVIQNGQGQHIMDEFRGVFREMQEEELRLLALRNAAANQRLGQTKTFLILGTFLGLLISAAAAWNVQRDSSRRAFADKALLDSEERFRGLLEAAPDAMVVVNQSGEIVLLNVQAEKQFGYRREELLGQKVKNIIPEGFVVRPIADGTRTATEALAHRIGTGIELSGRRKDGNEFPIEVMLRPLENADGILVTAAIRDITERKQAEETLRQSEESNRLIVSNTKDYSILMLDPGGNVVNWNEGAERIKGYRAEEIIGQHFSCFFPAEDISNGKPALELEEAARVGRFEDEGWRIRKDGSRFFASVVITALREETGLLRGFGKITRDITERKKFEEHLVKTAEELRRSNDLLQQFGYVASHDLQEPLRMVASYTQLLATRYKGRLDSDADEFIDYAVDGCNRMQGLIQDLLAYSRSGTSEKALREIPGENALKEALANLRATIGESGAIVTHDSLPSITTDEVQLVQVFQNLVGNAIKYCSAAVPLVHVSATKNGGNEWIFSVRDNGLGIEPQYFERIFIIFQRLHGRQEFNGTGIGLAICKKIVERLGGRIWVESQLAKGSTFYFALPETGEK
jgi:PAS domain S-box-containing protein